MTTAIQLDLLAPIEPPTPSGPLTLDERFAAFHESNPHVADLLERLAGEWFAAGNRRVGVKALFERMRWEYGVRTGTTPLLNNSLTSRYARLLIERHPEWEPLIETRGLRS